VDGALTASPGLHYVVAERADQQPVAEVRRIIKASPQITISLQKPAEGADALRQAQTRLRTAPLGRDEALGVSEALARPLFVVESRGETLVATRYAAGDVTRPLSVSEGADAGALVTAACAAEPGCIRPEPPPPPPVATVVLPPPVPPPPPHRPVWKRGWFWGVLGTTVVIAAGAAVGLGLGLTAPRDYELHVR
jgi:hypothetical protein